MNLASDVAKQLGCAWKPGQAFCNLHPRLMMSRSIVEVWKKHQSKIGHDKVFPSLEYCNIDASNDSLVKQVLDALMSLASKQWAERSWNKYRVVKKKVFHKSEEKMHKKLKMALQRAKNLVHVKQHYGVSFYEKIFFLH